MKDPPEISLRFIYGAEHSALTMAARLKFRVGLILSMFTAPQSERPPVAAHLKQDLVLPDFRTRFSFGGEQELFCPD
jgi:hypothetical protein